MKSFPQPVPRQAFVSPARFGFYLLAILCLLTASMVMLPCGHAVMACPPQENGEAGAKQAASDNETATITKVSAGFGGQFKLGYFTPVRIVIQGGKTAFRGRLEIHTLDGDGQPVAFADGPDVAPVEVAPRQVQRIVRYAKPGRINAELVVRLLEEDRVVSEVAANATPLTSTTRWVLGIGAEVEIDKIGGYGSRDVGRATVGTHVADVAMLPEHWSGYEAVDTVLVTAGDVDWADQLSPQQIVALEQWVQNGGHLSIAVAEQAKRLLGEEAPLSAFACGQLAEIRPNWFTSGLEAFTQAADPLPPEVDGSFAVWEQITGRVVCFETGGGIGDQAMIIQQPFGFGMLTHLAVDLDRGRIAEWFGRPRLVARLLGVQRRDETGGSRQAVGAVSHVGFSDVVGQLRGALDRFGGVILVHFTWVGFLLAVYILLIGPADYFAVKFLNRHVLTWLTFPVVVVLFCLLAIYLSRSFRGSTPQRNQVSVVDFDVASQAVRGTSWAHVYSPQPGLWQLQLDVPEQPVPPSSAVQLSWQGLPGRSLGGMQSMSRVTLQSEAYRILGHGADGPGNQISGLPVHVSFTKSLFARWSGSWDATDIPSLQSGLNGMLQGQISNPIDIELTRCIVAYENWAYRIPGRFVKGDPPTYFSDLKPLDFRWQLTRRRIVDGHDVTTPWSVTDFEDLPRIVEMMMFFEAAGGTAYTRLENDYQNFLDLSPHLRAGRAVLIGQGRAASTLNVEGADTAIETDKQLTLYRIVFPVLPKKGSDS